MSNNVTQRVGNDPSSAKDSQCCLLYLVGQLRPGGLERQLYFLLKGMDRERYRPEIVVWSFRSDDTYVRPIRNLGIKVHYFPETVTAIAKLRAFRRMVLQIKPEVIHSYSFYTNFAAWWAVRNTMIIPVGSFRSDFDYEQKGSGSLLGRLSGRWPRNQICNSYVAAQKLARSHSVFIPRGISVVRNGVDLQSFQKVPLPNRKRAVILGIGSLLPVKRWDRLFVLAAALKNRGLDFIIQVAGDGPLRKSLERQARNYDLVDKVQFLGHSDDVPGLLGDAHFVIHTSDTEGCPNAVIEAMACGRAVVATDVGDIPTLVNDHQTGFVVPRDNHQVLLDRVVRLITDLDLCRQMGEAGRAKAERELGLTRFVEETFSAYQRIGWRTSARSVASPTQPV